MTEPMQFDYIIVGAGSAGCVCADRLTADGRSTVLVIEAGGRNEAEVVDMPRGFLKMWGNPRYFWQFPVKPQPGRPEGESWTYGKGLGGSSSTNGTWYLRGMPADYDSWGHAEWRWAEIERCFKGLESYHGEGADPSRGTDGPLQVTRAPFRNPVLSAILEAGAQMGLPVLDDINTPNTSGIGYTQSTVSRAARRASAYRAFLKPAMLRPNLTVLIDTLVERVEIEGREATGVRCRRPDGSTVTYAARQAVILSAGVLQSPKLLQLSGIGPAEVLRAAGIPVLLDQPQVGRNLAEHAMFSVSYRLTNAFGANREFSGWRLWRHIAHYYLLRRGQMAFTSPEVTGLLAMQAPWHWPDVQIGVAPFSMRSSADIKADPGRGALEDKPGITLNGFYLRPKSRGSVAVQSASIDDPILVDANWWGDPADVATSVAMLRLMRDFARQPALSRYVGEETVPGPDVQSDAAIAKALEWMVSPGLHGTGTCRIGTPDNGVVDERLRVHGVAKLRVVDCSAMPTPMSANTNGPAMVLGARAAELILEDRDR